MAWSATCPHDQVYRLTYSLHCGYWNMHEMLVYQHDILQRSLQKWQICHFLFNRNSVQWTLDSRT